MKNFTVTLTQEQWNVIGAALGELAFRQVAPIINEINIQFQHQANTEDEKKAEETPAV